MNEESLFYLALEKSADERTRFLKQVCVGDDELRHRVEVLLQAHEHPDNFLARPAVDLAGKTDIIEVLSPNTNAPALRLGLDLLNSRVGAYRLREQLGEGGMGIVFLAEQERPIRRQVALKVIRPGIASGDVIARFEAERQALALMDHSNLAHVLDAGTTDSGRPYFVMELIRGAPITQFCDEQRLTLRQRLELFVPVCQAVQHAHHKGIIHRDLKPSNVLVTLCDGKPVPKVIDFGVAKAIGAKLTERTLLTEVGAVVGTLEYMSPEQAELNSLDVDTRSDVYTLGVLLYELLTGTTPLERERTRGPLLEALRLIREEEPPRPSTRLSATAALPGVAGKRGLEPGKLSGLVRGELDWIVMKCLEKDRDRRYDSANSLALDIERYLRDEPVLACPPSAGYRLSKFVRRNRGAVLAAAIVLLTLIGGVIGTTWAMIRATDAETAARLEAVAKETARAQAVAERDRALAAQTRALAAEADTRAFSEYLVNHVLAASRPEG
ncbi:MAG TPA: serine/threonine-protein kinase, partial [Gemmataceae bacterium]|nr:serine/threonine-protein kinase [Gemmataceae bacterium]